MTENEYNRGEVTVTYSVQANRCVYVSISGTYALTGVKDASVKSLGLILKSTIQRWYYAIRNIVIVVMMIVLLYIGIRIIISSMSSEKAKYKNMLMDWIVAIGLVFIMHYIMTFSIYLVEGLVEVFSGLGNSNEYVNIYEVTPDFYDKLKDEFSENNIDVDLDSLLIKEGNQIVKGKNKDGEEVQYLQWDAKNFLGMIRIQAALCESGTITYIGYGVLYLVFVFYTIFFLFTYLKRALYLAFLTIIAPFVAMTYPIDKLHDGKAQAFDMWFKEYIFNLAIQIIHLVLYTILVSSAFELASTNMIYSLVAIGFMMPAERFMRKMFGFNKAETPGLLGGAAGAALTMTALNKIFHKSPSRGGKSKENKEEKEEKEDQIKIKDDSKVDPNLLAGSNSSRNSSSNAIKVTPKVKNSVGATAESNQAAVRIKAKPQSDSIGSMRKNGITKSTSSLGSPASKNRFLKRKGRGIKAAAKTYAKGKAIKFGRSLASGKPIRNIARVAGGLYVGAAGAMLGGTLGLASGDLGKMGQYSAGLGVAGYGMVSGNSSHADIDRAVEEYRRSQYGSEEEYRKYLLEEQRKQVINNDKNAEQLRTYLKLDDIETAKSYMEQYGECIDAGITDMEDMATVITAVEDEQWSKEMAITAAKYYKKAGGKPKNMGKKDRENIEYQYKNIVRTNGVTDEKEVDETVKIMLKNLDKYGKIKDDLTQI